MRPIKLHGTAPIAPRRRPGFLRGDIELSRARDGWERLDITAPPFRRVNDRACEPHLADHRGSVPVYEDRPVLAACIARSFCFSRRFPQTVSTMIEALAR